MKPQDRLLSKAEAQLLKGRFGVDAHGIKKEVLGNKAPIARYDLYKDKQGNIYVKPKGGEGAGISTVYQF
jgi:hypothetical protein